MTVDVNALASQVAGQASAIAVMQTWLVQRQWLDDGGGMAGYPLPVASGPVLPLTVSAAASAPLAGPSLPVSRE